MTDPSVPARIVARLRRNETTDDGNDAVDITLLVDAGFVQERDDPSERLFGERVRLRRRDESGNRPLEEQLTAGTIFCGELDERTQELLQRSAAITGQGGLVEALEQLPVPIGEHRVVEGVLRVEVFVQGWLPHLDAAGQFVERKGRHAVLAGEAPRSCHDRRCLGLPPLCHLPRCSYHR
ncbi:MAG TPA: hypothetical protein VIC35_05885 [Acidimicrobiia bacterium]